MKFYFAIFQLQQHWLSRQRVRSIATFYVYQSVLIVIDKCGLIAIKKRVFDSLFKCGFTNYLSKSTLFAAIDRTLFLDRRCCC